MAHDEGDDRADQADRALGVEHAQPSQNSFAIAAVQRHRYMIQANAFYQQEWSAREGTPPSEIHPAFRQPDLISNLARPIPRLSPRPPHTTTPAPPTRESTVTTMSSLQRAAEQADTPEEINLGTTPDQTPRPTQRAFVEERAEQRRHLASGATDERIPVFHPTPKDPSDGFDTANAATHANARNASNANARDASHANADQPKQIAPPRAHTSPILDRPHRESSVKFKDTTDQIPDKTPKKGGLASSISKFFRPSSSRRSDVGTTPRPPSPMPSDETPTARLPPKAKQVLVGSSTPDPKVLGRSPSKKNVFSRRTSDLKNALSSSRKSKDKDEDESRGLPPRASTSMGFRADAGSMSSKSQTMTATPVMQGGSESGGSSQRRGNLTGLSRHHSLSWQDSHAPPTPPSKDTPPDEKIIRHLDKQKSPLTSFSDTPSRTAGFISSSSRVSPSRSGSYGQRFTPRLVTAPSMHSIRASVAVDPQGSDPDHLREMNDRIGGLGLEGFNMPSQYQQSPSLAYSPSVYSQEWGDNPPNSFIDIPDRVPEVEEGEMTPTRPTPQMSMVRRGRSLSTGTLNTAVTSVTVDLVYPELRNDPSIAAFQKYELTPPPASNPPSASNTPAMATAFQDLENALQSTASAGSARDQRSLTPQTPEPRQLSRTDERRAPLANLFGLSSDSGGSQTPRSQGSEPVSAGSVTSFRAGNIDIDALSSGRKSDIQSSGAIHPAYRTFTQQLGEMSPMSNHPSARVSPLDYRQRVDRGDYLAPAAYHPTAPGNSTGLRPEFTPVVPQDAGVARMRQALAAEHESPAARRRPSNIMDNRPNLLPTSAAAESGVRSPRGARRFPRSRDLSPVKESSSSGSRPASPTRVASHSRIPRPTYAHQQAAPRTEQQQPNSLGIHEQTSRAPRTSPFGDDTSVTRMTNAREEDRRRFTRESQALSASLDRRFARTKKTLDDEAEPDSGVDIENYKNNAGSHRSDANEHKRLSTHHARQFYLSPSPAGETPDNSRSGTPNTSATNESEASTLVLTPNLPFSFPRPPGGAPVSSSQLTGYEPRPTVADMGSPTPAEPRARSVQAGNASTATGGGDASGDQTTSRKISAMASGRTGAASGNTVTSSNNTSTTSSRRAPTRVSSLESTAHTSSSDTLPSTATSRKTSTTAASSTTSSRAAPGTAQAQIAALNNRFAPPANPPPTVPLPPAPPNMGAGANASQAQQLQLLMTLAQQQGETLRNLTLQMNRLEMNQRVQATQQVNDQAGQTVVAPVNQQQTQAAQQAAQANQQMAQASQQMAQVTQQAAQVTQPAAQNTQQAINAVQAGSTAQQTDHSSSDEEDRDGWFNPG